MAKFIFNMPEDIADSVEAFRVSRGHKSTAEAVRELLRSGVEVMGRFPQRQAHAERASIKRVPGPRLPDVAVKGGPMKPAPKRGGLT